MLQNIVFTETWNEPCAAGLTIGLYSDLELVLLVGDLDPQQHRGVIRLYGVERKGDVGVDSVYTPSFFTIFTSFYTYCSTPTGHGHVLLVLALLSALKRPSNAPLGSAVQFHQTLKFSVHSRLLPHS